MREDNSQEMANKSLAYEQNIRNLDLRIAQLKEQGAKVELEEQINALSKKVTNSQEALDNALKTSQEIKELYTVNQEKNLEINELLKERGFNNEQLELANEGLNEAFKLEEERKFFSRVMENIAENNFSSELLEEFKQKGGELFEELFRQKSISLAEGEDVSEFKMREIFALVASELMEDRERRIFNSLDARLNDLNVERQSPRESKGIEIIEEYKQTLDKLEQEYETENAKVTQRRSALKELNKSIEDNKEAALSKTEQLLNKKLNNLTDQEIDNEISEKLSKLRNNLRNENIHLQKLQDSLAKFSTTSIASSSQTLAELEAEKQHNLNALRELKRENKTQQASLNHEEASLQSPNAGFKRRSSLKDELEAAEENMTNIPAAVTMPPITVRDDKEVVIGEIDVEVEDMSLDAFEADVNNSTQFSSIEKEEVGSIREEIEQAENLRESTVKENKRVRSDNEISIGELVKEVINKTSLDEELALSLQSEELSKTISEAFDLRMAKELQAEFNHLIRQELDDRKMAQELQSKYDHSLAKEMDQIQNDKTIAKVLGTDEDFSLAQSLQSEEDRNLAKEMDQIQNDRAIAKVLATDEDFSLAQSLQSEEDHKLAKEIDQIQNDRAIAKILQKNEYSTFSHKILSEKEGKPTGVNEKGEGEDKIHSWKEFLEHLLTKILSALISKDIKKDNGSKFAVKVNESEKQSTRLM